ncbi:MAG: protein kinase [Myxococcales bacterium]|nr:protein kinase [Myxococcales bacterium]
MGLARDSAVVRVIEGAIRQRRSGVLGLRYGAEEGRVYLTDGRLAWAAASAVKSNLYLRLVEATGQEANTIQRIFDESKKAGKNFGEAMIERGLLDEPRLREILLEHVAGCLAHLGTWPTLEATFTPDFRAYRTSLTFTLEEVLERASQLESQPVQPPAGDPPSHRKERVCPRCGKRHPDTVSYCSVDGTRLSEIDSVPEALAEGTALVGAVLGSYRITHLLGEGGMGFVYLAEHTRLGRKVALKMLRQDSAGNPGAVKRFFVEARAVNQIKHENIIEITDFVEDERGRNYYIMEHLEGRTLSEEIGEKGAMSARRAMAIAAQAASALAAAHAAGVVHRDLKPDNVFLTTRGERKDVVKLLDFGVAKLAGPLPDLRQLHKTAAGAILGTPEYMSPEQVSGKEVDYRSDLYSLGVIMFEMVTGKKPFQAKTFGEMVIKHLTVKPPRPSQLKDTPVRLPRVFEDLILECLDKDPARRPRDAKEIEDRLRKYAGLSSVQLESLGPETRRRRPAWLVAAIAIGSLAAAGAALFFALRRETSQPPPPSPPPLPPPVADAAMPQEPPPPPPPAMITVSFETTPAGAEVWREGGEVPLGKTPLSLTFEHAEKKATFELRLPGFEKASREILLDKDAQVVVALTRLKKTPRPDAGKPEPDPHLDNDTTIDPFDE